MNDVYDKVLIPVSLLVYTSVGKIFYTSWAMKPYCGVVPSASRSQLYVTGLSSDNLLSVVFSSDVIFFLSVRSEVQISDADVGLISQYPFTLSKRATTDAEVVAM